MSNPASGDEVTEEDVDIVLPPDLGPPVIPEQLAAETADSSLNEFRDIAERAFIAARLREHHWNIAETARALGMQRSNLYSKIEKYGIGKGRT